MALRDDDRQPHDIDASLLPMIWDDLEYLTGVVAADKAHPMAKFCSGQLCSGEAQWVPRRCHSADEERSLELIQFASECIARKISAAVGV